MAGFVLRRVLLMIPTFLGITALTFFVATLAGEPALHGGDGEEHPGRRLRPEDAQALREQLELDKPALFNANVQDARRSVESGIGRAIAAGPGAARDGELRTLIALRGMALPALAEAALNGASEGTPATDEAHAALRAAVVEASAGRLRPAFDRAEADAVLAALARLDPAALAGRWAQAIEARAAPDAALLGDLDRLGGLAVPAVVDALRRAPPRAKAELARFLEAHAGHRARHPAVDASSEATPSQLQEIAIADRALERWWMRHALRFRTLSPLERWGRYAWTDTRYARWLADVLRFDFGDSILHRRPVSEIVGERLPLTLAVQAASVVLMLLIGVPLGVWSAVRRGSGAERAVSGALFVLYAAPDFWLATLAVLWLNPPFPIDGSHDPAIAAALRDGVLSPWSPDAIRDLAFHLALPVAVLVAGGIVVFLRYTRFGLQEVLRQDYIRTARAKGVPERVILFKHALRPGIVPVVTLLGAVLPALAGGSVVVERAFNLPGMGHLVWDSARHVDIPVVMAVVTVFAVLTMAGYALSDLVAGWLDPRIAAR